MRKKSLFGVALVAALAMSVAAAPAPAATKSIKLVYKANLTGTKVAGTFKSKQLGNGKMAGNVNLPYFTITFKSDKGGTFVLVLKGAPVGDKVKGKWTIKKGTGKFKKIKASGTAVGSPVNGAPFTFTGKGSF